MLDLSLEDEFPILPRFDENRLRSRHRWYEFKEGFSAQLVYLALEAQKKRRPRVLDPFSGCGTTAISALEEGCDVTAIEVNPFLAFATRAKASRALPSQRLFEETLKDILRAAVVGRRSHLEGVSTFGERPGVAKWLFNKSVLRCFAALDAQLAKTGALAPPLRLALLAATMDACNARRDGKCLRYRSDWQERGYSSSEVRENFARRAKEVVDDLRGSRLTGRLQVIRGDSRVELARLASDSVDLTVTSPPYLNSFDYSDVYRPELFLGGFVRSNAELMKIRLRTLRSHLQADWPYEAKGHLPVVSRVVARLARQEGLWNSRLPIMVAAYFDDMRTVLRELARVTAPGGQLWLVVATSAYGSVHIEVDRILMAIAETVGWAVGNQHELRRLRSSGQTWAKLSKEMGAPLRETLLVFERPSGGRRRLTRLRRQR